MTKAGSAARATGPASARLPGEAAVPARLRAIALWALALAPVAFLPGLALRWGWPTLVVVLVAAVCASGVAPAGRMPRSYTVLIGATVALLALVALLGDAPLPQLLGRSPRHEGLILFLALAVTGWTGSRLLGPGAAPADRRHFANALSLASVFLAAVAVLEALGLRPIESDLLRPGSVVGNATDQGIVGAVMTAVLGSFVLGAQRRGARLSIWILVGAIAGIVSVATSASRAGILALVVVALGLGLRFLVGSRHRRRDALLTLGGLSAVAVVVLALPLTRARLLGPDGFARGTIEDRFIMWRDAGELFLSSPWIGVGPSGFGDAITLYFDDGWFDRTDPGAILDSPHNIAVQAAVVAGIPGVLLALLLVGGALLLGIRHLRATTQELHADALWGALIAVVAAGTALLTHLTTPTTLVLLATLVGVLVAVPATRHDPWPWVGRALLLTGLFCVLAFTAAEGFLRAGSIAAAEGDPVRADRHFHAAQSLRPWDVYIALAAAQALGGAADRGLAGAIDPAVVWAQRAVGIVPLSSHAHYVAGMTAGIAGDAATSADHLATAAELSPADPRIHHELGVARLVSGDPRGAIDALERAAQLAPGSRITWVALRDACRQVGDEECALRAETRVAEARP